MQAKEDHEVRKIVKLSLNKQTLRYLSEKERMKEVCGTDSILICASIVCTLWKTCACPPDTDWRLCA